MLDPHVWYTLSHWWFPPPHCLETLHFDREPERACPMATWYAVRFFVHHDEYVTAERGPRASLHPRPYSYRHS